MGLDVIIVEPLYRLGPFGFTYLGIPEAPGNQGFMDVVKALEWVQINIEAFGGDPNRVTIFGESSGSWVVSYLHLTPTANGLFHRGILQSGSLLNPYWTWQTANDSMRLADGLAGAFNCSTMPTDDPYAGLDCLQNLPYKDLEQSINWGMEETFQIQKIFRPTGVIDGTFLPDHPVKMMERGEYNHVDLMVGLNKDEGLLQTFSLISHPELYPALMFGWPQTFGPMFLFGRPGNVFSTENDLGMVEDLTTYYLPNGQWDFNDDHFQNITDLISDAFIWYGGHKQGELAAKNGDNVYQYLYGFTGSHSFGDALGIKDGYKYGVCHADELWYFWLRYWNQYFWSLTEEEKVFSLKLRKTWANFARYGTPTLPGDETNWEPLTADNDQYMNINNDGWTMELSEDYVNRMANWDAYYTYPEGDTIPDIPEIKITKQQQSPFSYFNQLRP
jgi:acetylcholinesterase